MFENFLGDLTRTRNMRTSENAVKAKFGWSPVRWVNGRLRENGSTETAAAARPPEQPNRPQEESEPSQQPQGKRTFEYGATRPAPSEE